MTNRIPKGEEYSVCQTCQNVFKQKQYVNIKTGETEYEKYANCPECRKKIVKVEKEDTKQVQVSIQYQPYE